MSIVKSTGSGVNAPLTEAFLLKRGYKKDRMGGYFAWKVPTFVDSIGNYQLKSDEKNFYVFMWLSKPPTIIKTIQALLYLEKHWSAEGPEMNKYAELVELCQS